MAASIAVWRRKFFAAAVFDMRKSGVLFVEKLNFVSRETISRFFKGGVDMGGNYGACARFVLALMLLAGLCRLPSARVLFFCGIFLNPKPITI